MGINIRTFPFGTTTIGNSVLQKALTSKLEPIIVVTRENDSLRWINSTLFETPLRKGSTCVTCHDVDKGQAHSLRWGFSCKAGNEAKGGNGPS